MNWDVGRHSVTDEEIRRMPETLRERIAQYQEQRREGQQIMHKLANPPEHDFLETGSELAFWGEKGHRAAFCIVALLAIIVVQLAVIIAALA